MNGKIVMDCIDAAYASIKEHAEEIMVLDQSIGDGDHVFNLIRGLEALRSIRGDIETLEAGPALKLAANKVRVPLWSLIFDPPWNFVRAYFFQRQHRIL